MKKISLLIADDHPIFLEGLCASMRAKYPEFDIVAAVPNGKEAVAKEAELGPDIVLLDIRMPVMDGVEAARRIRRRRPDAKVIMLTTFNERDLVTSAFEAGAVGYILKETPLPDVAMDIKSVWRGNVLMTSKVAEQLEWGPAVRAKPPEETEPSGASRRMTEPLAAELRWLTRRDREVFRGVLEGLPNKVIAARLGVTEGTVRNHVSRVYEVIGVASRTAAVVWAFERGLRPGDLPGPEPAGPKG
jgi:DNA-binding NarL/FixJ family response regulator